MNVEDKSMHDLQGKSRLNYRSVAGNSMMISLNIIQKKENSCGRNHGLEIMSSAVVVLYGHVHNTLDRCTLPN